MSSSAKRANIPKEDRRDETAEQVTLPYVAERLHNGIQQSVTGLRLLAHTLDKRIPADATVLKEQFAELQQMLSDCGDELSSVMNEIRSGVRRAATEEPSASE